MADLESIYRRTLSGCAPEVIVRQAVGESMPRQVVAVGKCAGRMLDGVSFDRAICIVPRGYPRPDLSRPAAPVTICEGGHPNIDDDSFAAGQQLLAFIDQCRGDVLFLISGGGSACAEVPLPPFTREEISATNRQLVASALSIAEINTVRKHLSAIKGGKLAGRVRGRCVTLVYSDVSTGAIGDVASGPTFADETTNSEAARILERVGGRADVVAKLRAATEAMRPRLNTSARIIADNGTLAATAATLVERPVVLRAQIESSVEAAAIMLAERAAALQPGEVLIAGGEPTVARHGSGKGGRCCELAVRFAMHCGNPALFGSSDGVDGSSGVAGILVDPASGPEERLRAAPELLALLAASESLAAANLVGRAVMMPPTGNNLRDLFLVAGA